MFLAYLRRWQRAQAECQAWEKRSVWRDSEGYYHMYPYPWRAWLIWGAHAGGAIAVGCLPFALGALWMRAC